MEPEETVRNLTLMLMYLTSWTERLGELQRCWKGYDFKVLDQLVQAGLISSSRRAKSAYITEEGESRAIELLSAHGFSSYSPTFGGAP